MNQRHLCLSLHHKKVESAGGPVSFLLGGRRVPSSPEPPSTLFSVPGKVLQRGTDPRLHWERKLRTTEDRTTPKPTELDPRVGPRRQANERTIRPQITGSKLTRSLPSIY